MELTLKSLFKGETKPTPSEAAYAASIIMLTELVKAQTQVSQQGAQPQIAQRLKRIGMTNAYVTREQRMHGENIARLAFMLDMWRDLGTHAVLVSLDDFRDILRRHDLMCAPLDRYFGDIPTEKIAEIERADWQSEESRFDRYFERAKTPDKAYYSTYDEFVDINRAPFINKGGDPSEAKYLMTQNVKIDIKLFIAAPKGFIAKGTSTIADGASRGLRDVIFKAQRNGYVGRIEEMVPRQLPYNYDPFICSLCDYGVIIHSMWGAEAEDATIKRYEQLRDAIIGSATPKLTAETPLMLKGGEL